MQTLSNGYQLPEDGDLGDVWFPALAANISRVNGHTHNGVDSEKLPGTSVLLAATALAAGSFTLQGDVYRATVTFPINATVDTTRISFRDPTTKETLYLRTQKLSTNSVYVFCNAQFDVEVVYG